MTKKIFSCLAFALALTACTEDYTDWNDPQHNDAIEAVGKYDMTVTPAVQAVDLGSETAGRIILFTTNAAQGQAQGYTLTMWGTDEDKNVEIQAEADGTVATAELQDAVAALYGRAPIARTVNVKVKTHARITAPDGSEVRTMKVAAPFTVSITPNAPYISQHYWIVGAPSQWDVMCTTLPFEHSGNDVYDDPVFTVTFPVTAGETWLAIADDKTHEMADWSGLLGCAEGNGNNGLEGSIARRTEIGNDGSWKIVASEDCTVRMTINMMDYTYRIDFILFEPYVYLPGDANGWSFDRDILLGNNEGQYEGYAVLGGQWGWKVTQYPDWNHGDYGNAGDGKIASGCGNIMEGSEPKQYHVKVDLASMTYELTEISSWSIIGSVKGAWDTDVDMTANLDDRCWIVTADLGAGEFKFRANHDWGKNLGGTYDSMVGDGANLQLPEDGNYTITLYPSYNGASHCTVVKN